MPKRRNELRERLSPAAVVFALLVLATLAAFAYSQRAKREPLVLDRVTFIAPPHRKGTPKVHSFTPNGDCRRDRIRIKFRTTISGDGLVQVIKPGGRVVVTLARDTFLRRYTFHVYYWDGRQRGGGTAKPGRYKLRVKLGSERTLVTPGTIRLHPSPKEAKSRCGTRGGAGGVGP
ncbi:MAG TPA: hypothetical protein VNC16_06970 [Solirubrobacterales bacterium]|jgi:hypothetical protein|nr:hypothetical protein [Solirubrobacterales bacterium]